MGSPLVEKHIIFSLKQTNSKLSWSPTFLFKSSVHNIQGAKEESNDPEENEFDLNVI